MDKLPENFYAMSDDFDELDTKPHYLPKSVGHRLGEKVERLEKALEWLLAELRSNQNTGKGFYEHCHGRVIRITETGK